MRQKKNYYLGGVDFQSQKELVELIKYVLKTKTEFEDLDSTTTEIAKDLVNLHPRSKEKIGCGIRSIQVHNGHFQIMRVDGSSTDFSYKKCFESPISKLRLFKVAAREAIKSQITEFREQFSFDEWFGKHVDHVNPTFNMIVENFIKENNIDIESVEFGGFEDNETNQYFIDEELKNRFYEYHKLHAVLQLLDAQENLKKGSKIL
jgi:hypothetical protein